MSYFSVALQTVLEDKGLTQSELSKNAGLDSGLMSRYAAGSIRPSLQVLEKLCLQLEPKFRAEIAAAHLKDELPESALALVRIEPVDEAKGHAAPVVHQPSRAKLPKDLRDAFDFLERMAIDNPDLSDHIKTLARMLRNCWVKDCRADDLLAR